MNKKYLIGGVIVVVAIFVFFLIRTKSSDAPFTALPIVKAVFSDTKKTIQFEYPEEVTIVGGEVLSTSDWRQMGDRAGNLFVTATLPREFQPKTNFSEAKFTVGKSADKDAVKNCLVEQNVSDKDGVLVETQNVHFIQFTFGDAAAGNYYETKSYRVVHDNECYAVEYTIHSTNLGNYSSDQGITEFDKAKVEAILEGMVKSFKFL